MKYLSLACCPLTHIITMQIGLTGVVSRVSLMVDNFFVSPPPASTLQRLDTLLAQATAVERTGGICRVRQREEGLHSGSAYRRETTRQPDWPRRPRLRHAEPMIAATPEDRSS